MNKQDLSSVVLGIMKNEVFSLKWNFFQNVGKEMFQNIQTDQTFSDVTLVCDGNQQIKAHKVILSACSQFFKDILLANPHPHPLLFLKGVKMSILDKIIGFVYQGEAEVNQHELDNFLSVAVELKIKGLHNRNEGASYKETEDVDIDIDIDIDEDNGTIEDDGLKPQDDCGNKENIKKHTVFKEETQINKGLEVKEELKENHVKPDQNKLCMTCDKTFKNPGQLYRHVQSVHEGVKHDCTYCRKSFSTIDSLGRHVKVAHENIRYNCDHCESSYTSTSAIKRHKLKHHSL
jgi:hypothetical protein